MTSPSKSFQVNSALLKNKERKNEINKKNETDLLQSTKSIENLTALPRSADQNQNKNKDQNPEKPKDTEANARPALSFADALKKSQTNAPTKKSPEQTASQEKKEEIHNRIFHTVTYTPDQSPSGIEKKVAEILSTIAKTTGPGGVVSVQYKGRGQYAIELKTRDLLEKVLQSGLHFPGDNQHAPLKPRRNQILLITIKTDASTLNEEIAEALRPFGKIVNISYGYYMNNRLIRDGRRLIHIIPTVPVDKIPPTVQIDYRVHQLYFKGKTTQTRQTQQETEKLLEDLELSDTDIDADEMSQEENPLPTNENSKEEAKTPQTITENKNHTKDSANALQETPTNSKDNTKTAIQPPTTKDTKTAQISIKTTQTQKGTETQKTHKTDENTKTEEETPLPDASLPNTPMETDNTPNENTQKPTKRKSETTLTKNDKQSADNPNKTKRKPHRI